MNVLDSEELGNASLQPCEKCAVIKESGPLKDGVAVCPRCGARWISVDDKHADDSPGCALMFWSAVVAIVIFGLMIIKSCRGGIK